MNNLYLLDDGIARTYIVAESKEQAYDICIKEYDEISDGYTLDLVPDDEDITFHDECEGKVYTTKKAKEWALEKCDIIACSEY